MVNKKSLVLLSSVFVVLGLSTVSSANFKLELPRSDIGRQEYAWTSNISAIHFAENWNDFWWFVYISKLEPVWWESDDWEGTTEDWEILQWWVSITLWTDTYQCMQEIHWYYYNSQRWERLRPLDETTKGLFWNSLYFEWGLYTSCRNEQKYNEEIGYCQSCDESSWYWCNWSFVDSIWGDASIYFSEWEEWEEMNDAKDSFISDCIKYINSEFSDDKWIYWSIEHEYQWQSYYLLAWVEYEAKEWEQRVDVNESLAPTLQRFIYKSSSHPVGFIYDKNGWVGFVWCEVEGTETKNLIKYLGTWDIVRCFTWWDGNKIVYAWWTEGCPWTLNCTNIWLAWQSLIWLIIDWLVWMSTDNNLSQLEDFDRWSISKTQYFSSVNISSSSLISYAKMAAESLCRWRWNANNNDESVVCFKWADIIWKDYIWKTLIVKNWNVKVSPLSATLAQDWKYYDIFVDGWNIIIEDGDDSNLFLFNKNWFYNENTTNENLSSFRQAVSDANGAINESDCRNNKGYRQGFGADDSWFCFYDWDYVAVGALLRWNFIANWNIEYKHNGKAHKYFIYWKFSTLDNYDWLNSAFSWKCSDGKWSDGYPCPTGKIAENHVSHNYGSAPLVVIDQNYSSPLFW